MTSQTRKLAKLAISLANMGMSPPNLSPQSMYTAREDSYDVLTVDSYVDPYLSTVPGSPYFFGDKSVVLHTTNTTRLICANFVQVSGSSPNGTATGTAGGSSTPTGPSSTASVQPYMGAGVRESAGMFGVFAAIVAALAI